MPLGERLVREGNPEGVAWAGVSQGSGDGGGVACVGATGGGRTTVLAYYQV